MVFSFIVCVYNPVLPACYSNCCFLECSLLKTFFDKLLMMVVCGSDLKWSEESWCSEFLDFFPEFHRTTSLEFISFWEASMLYQHLLLHLSSLLFAGG